MTAFRQLFDSFLLYNPVRGTSMSTEADVEPTPKRLKWVRSNEEQIHFTNSAKVVEDMRELSRRKINFVFAEGLVLSEEKMAELRKSNPSPHEQHFRSATAGYLGQYLAMGKDLGLWRTYRTEGITKVHEYDAEGNPMIYETTTDLCAVDFGNPFIFMMEKMREERAAQIVASLKEKGAAQQIVDIVADDKDLLEKVSTPS